MNKHPYPVEVVTAVADVLKPLTASRIEAGNLAHQALNAAWEASRVECLAEVEVLPNNAILKTAKGLTEYARTLKFRILPNDYPAHVIYWGEAQ